MSDEKVVSIEQTDEILLAVVHCEQMKESETQVMQTEVLASAEQARHLPVVLDLSDVAFIPSVTLGALVVLLQELKKSGQRFLLAGLQPDVRGTLALTRLDKLFEICDTRDDALAQVRKSR